jgi:hypothetical protein
VRRRSAHFAEIFKDLGIYNGEGLKVIKVIKVIKVYTCEGSTKTLTSLAQCNGLSSNDKLPSKKYLTLLIVAKRIHPKEHCSFLVFQIEDTEDLQLKRV